MQTTAQLAKVTAYNKSLFGISIGAFVVNFVAALWAFSLTGVIEHDSWKILVFKTVFYFTGILSPYVAVSVLLPQKFAWYLFATICVTMMCVIIILFKNVLKSRLTLSYEKVVYATRWMLLNMTPDDQVPTTDAAPAPEYHQATARIAAEEEQNLGGSGSSPNLSWLSATAGLASEEQPNLNEFTIIPL
ncbi:hypothetical protein CTI12_AA249290 [Artemisia annua]|uniref:Uncharacterized protein n=1 Tax=Artemisia annua TaxID=35608 RepID=A0A2U1NMP5_ARTAN|nr:hypothetical protein CTI12_AA249290 [Artemisia annua]